MSHRFEVEAFEWPEVAAGDDLGALAASTMGLQDGDIVVITSKVVSKSEGLVRSGDRTSVIDSETVRVVARRASTVIAQTPRGLVVAAAGVDASNVDPGLIVTLPSDPDASARLLRRQIRTRTGANVGVVISDTAGRAWRVGQTDHAIGCAGVAVILDYAGSTDPYGNALQVTATAIADELAAAADLSKAKTTRRPAARVRGLGDAVLGPDDDGRGAVCLVRDADSDLFGLGSRDAVAAALARDARGAGSFPRFVAGDPDPFDGLHSDHPSVLVDVRRGRHEWQVSIAVKDDADDDGWVAAGRLVEQVEALAYANRLRRAETEAQRAESGWRLVARWHWIVA